ncbi:molybdopterin-binding protein [Roseobacter sp. N2S]|uniref:competence/damage-inducible protein A n=1 Tax=Roseobacter sp. N2S TaxID=2663844 RepID=UPI00286737E5|nr:molybdopterin-binding protein [Roseobacter sp. N2S]MDR6263338.1 molybdenum cofactor synthesis domain-containing protein [Roseobacter sp. N2S]
MANPTAAMLVIGDEILSGRTRDANMYHLAGRLTDLGIDLKEVRVVSDDAAEIVAAVNGLRGKFDHVFTSGGIGPTHDDITADNVAAAFGIGIDVREDAMDALATNYPDGRASINAARMRMARIPDGARLIDNSISKAPGFSVENVHVMAGVPKIFEAMLDSLLPSLKSGTPVVSETTRVDQPEGAVAGPLGDIAAEFATLSIGSYPFNTPQGFGTNLVVRGADAALVAQAAAKIRQTFGVE